MTQHDANGTLAWLAHAAQRRGWKTADALTRCSPVQMTSDLERWEAELRESHAPCMATPPAAAQELARAVGEVTLQVLRTDDFGLWQCQSAVVLAQRFMPFGMPEEAAISVLGYAMVMSSYHMDPALHAKHARDALACSVPARAFDARALHALVASIMRNGDAGHHARITLSVALPRFLQTIPDETRRACMEVLLKTHVGAGAVHGAVAVHCPELLVLYGDAARDADALAVYARGLITACVPHPRVVASMLVAPGAYILRWGVFSSCSSVRCGWWAMLCDHLLMLFRRWRKQQQQQRSSRPAAAFLSAGSGAHLLRYALRAARFDELVRLHACGLLDNTLRSGDAMPAFGATTAYSTRDVSSALAREKAAPEDMRVAQCSRDEQAHGTRAAMALAFVRHARWVSATPEQRGFLRAPSVPLPAWTPDMHRVLYRSDASVRARPCARSSSRTSCGRTAYWPRCRTSCSSCCSTASLSRSVASDGHKRVPEKGGKSLTRTLYCLRHGDTPCSRIRHCV